MYSIIVFSLSVIVISQLKNPALAFGADVICESRVGFSMTHKQVQLCKNYTGLMPSLFTDVLKKFRSHCYSQFKYERWNCKDIIPPIFGAKQSPFLSLNTKEAAFVHALASAAVVHTVAEKCAESSLPYCGCLKSNDEDLPNNETWEGCSPDIYFALNFTKQFVDCRESNASLEHKAFALHNNRVGRQVVSSYMHKTCTCVGNNGSGCSGNKSCVLVLPSMAEVARKLKRLYEQSVYSIIITSLFTQGVIIVDRENNHSVSTNKTIYFSHSPDYCLANSSYKIAGIEGRECDLSNSSSSQHCDNLCCDHGYENTTVTEKKFCNCKFVWCCRIECDSCNTTRMIRKCRGELEESSTSYIDILA